MLNISNNLIDSLNAAQIRWVVWKGTNHYLDGFNGIGDADILIKEADKFKATEILKTNGFIKYTSPWPFSFDDIEDWLGFDTITGKLVHIHLHYHMRIGEPYVNENYISFDDIVFDNAVQTEENIFIQCPAIDFLISCIRINYSQISRKKTEGIKLFYQNSNLLNDVNGVFSLLGVTKEECNLLYNSLYNPKVNKKSVRRALNRFVIKKGIFPKLVNKGKETLYVFERYYNKLITV